MNRIDRELGRVLPRAALTAVLLGCAALTTPAHAATVAQEAQTMIDGGRAAEALAKLDSHLAKRPEDAEARFARALALVKLERNKDAIRAFADLTRDYPQLPEPYNNLAVLYAAQGEYEKARDALKAAVGRHPGYAVAHENLGDIYAALASAAYGKVLALDSGNRSARAKLDVLKQIGSGLGAQVSAAPAKPAVPAPAPAAAPTPAAATAPAAEPPAAAAAAATSAAAGAPQDTALPAVEAWARAWAAKDFDAYFGAYADSFVPEGGISRDTWQAQRRDRITRPKTIKVEISEPAVSETENGGLRVVFSQTYQSDAYVDTSTKVLELIPVDGVWKIAREYSR